MTTPYAAGTETTVEETADYEPITSYQMQQGLEFLNGQLQRISGN